MSRKQVRTTDHRCCPISSQFGPDDKSPLVNPLQSKEVEDHLSVETPGRQSRINTHSGHDSEDEEGAGTSGLAYGCIDSATIENVLSVHLTNEDGVLAEFTWVTSVSGKI